MIVFGAGLSCGAAWLLNSHAATLPMLYLAQAIGGLGAGAVYGAAVGNALKWFPDRRGLAAGVTAAGFGVGSALTIVPISAMIANRGYQSAFFAFGLLQGVTLCLCALFLNAPRKAAADGSFPVAGVAHPAPGRRNYAPLEMAKTPTFWLMYLMFVLMAAGGLMATAQLAPIAKDFGVADVPVSFIGVTLPALTFALSIDRLLNGVTRPLFGWVSDRIGREQTMFIAFCLEGVAIWRSAVSATRQGFSCCSAASSSSRGAKSTASFPPLAPTPSAQNSPPRTPVCFTPPRARRRFLCPFPAF